MNRDTSFLRTVVRVPVNESCPEGGSSLGVTFTEPLEFTFHGLVWRANGERNERDELLYFRQEGPLASAKPYLDGGEAVSPHPFHLTRLELARTNPESFMPFRIVREYEDLGPYRVTRYTGFNGREDYAYLRHPLAEEGERIAWLREGFGVDAERLWNMHTGPGNEVEKPKVGAEAYATMCVMQQRENRKGRKNKWRDILTGGRGSGSYYLFMPEKGLARQLHDLLLAYHNEHDPSEAMLVLANGTVVKDPRG